MVGLTLLEQQVFRSLGCLMSSLSKVQAENPYSTCSRDLVDISRQAANTYRRNKSSTSPQNIAMTHCRKPEEHRIVAAHKVHLGIWLFLDIRGFVFRVPCSTRALRLLLLPH